VRNTKAGVKSLLPPPGWDPNTRKGERGPPKGIIGESSLYTVAAIKHDQSVKSKLKSYKNV
jgi:hypothetical protein